jgi:hypothetical protein
MTQKPPNAGGGPPAVAPPARTWRELLTDRKEKKWDSFSWTTLRALVSSLNHGLNLKMPRMGRHPVRLAPGR